MDTVSIRPGVPELLASALLAVALATIIVLSKAAVAVGLTLSILLVCITFFSPAIGLYLLVFSMLLGPEVLLGELGGGAIAVRIQRGVTLRLDDFLLLSVGVGWLALTALAPTRLASTRTPLNRPIQFYIISCVLSTLVGVLADRVVPLAGFFFVLKYFEYFFLFFMTVSIVNDREQVKTLIACALVTCFLVSLYAIAQIPGSDRVSAPFEGEEGEPNTLGGYLVFMLAIGTGFLLTPKSFPKRLPLIVMMVTATVALLATLSRASFLAAGVLLLALLAVIARRNPLLLTVLLAAVVSMPWVMPKAVQNRVMFTIMQPPEEGQMQVGRLRIDTSTSDRLRSWRRSGDMFQKFPLLGTGVTGGPFMDAQYPRVLVETGLLGIVSFLILLRALYRLGKDAYDRVQDPTVRGLALGFLLGFLGLIIHAIGANTFIIVRIMEPFWFFAALLVRASTLALREQPAEIPWRERWLARPRGPAPTMPAGPR